MIKRIIGVCLFIVFGFNLIFSLFFGFGESTITHIIPIALSLAMLFVAYRLVRSKHKSGAV